MRTCKDYEYTISSTFHVVKLHIMQEEMSNLGTFSALYKQL